MKFLISSLVVISQLSICAVVGDIPRPLGVPLSESGLYATGDIFTCFDGSLQIKSSQINDDFCDCPYDGSDEPGTSACPNGHFYCENVGFKPMRIPSSRVGDGICDCCDGTDEYSRLKVNQCPNTCHVLGKEEKERQLLLADIVKRGALLRAEMSVKGKTSKDEHTSRLVVLEQSVQQAVTLKTERETIKLNAEKDETAALDVYKKLAEEEKKLREEAEALARERLQQFEQEQLYLQQQQQQQHQQEQEQAPSDEGVTEVPLAPQAGHASEADDLANLGEASRTVGEHDEPEFDETAELQNEDDTEAFDEEEEETGEGHVAQVDTHPEYDDETKRLIEVANEARSHFDTADRELRQLESEKRQLEEQLGRDYGTDEEFAILNGECFNFEDREYVYKLCPFDRAVQQPKNGGGETRLGTWDRWDGSPNKYSKMVYANGAGCWNGPQRSTIVEVECGLDTRVTSVSEPNRCEYLYKFETPAACTGEAKAQGHDEL